MQGYCVTAMTHDIALNIIEGGQSGQGTFDPINLNRFNMCIRWDVYDNIITFFTSLS